VAIPTNCLILDFLSPKSKQVCQSPHRPQYSDKKKEETQVEGIKKLPNLGLKQ